MTREPDVYGAFRRAHGLWLTPEGVYETGVWADSPGATFPGFPRDGYRFVGWIAGTEYGDDEAYWETVELTFEEAAEFAANPAFVGYHEASGAERAAAVIT